MVVFLMLFDWSDTAMWMCGKPHGMPYLGFWVSPGDEGQGDLPYSEAISGITENWQTFPACHEKLQVCRGTVHAI
jgi:hypothetical protein